MTNRIKDAFSAIHAEDALKANTREYLRLKTQKRASTFALKYAPLVAACLVVCALLTGGTLVFTPVSAITVDVNPSIELGINRFDRVISVIPANDDGRALADALDIKYLFYADALEKMVKSEAMAGYISNGEQISITVVNSDDDKSDEMLYCINSRSGLKRGNIYCSSSNREEAAAAREAGLPLGKYRAFLELKKLDPDAVTEDVKGLSMRRIRDMIYAASGGLDDLAEAERGNGYGYGCGKRGARANGRQGGG